MGDLGRFIDGNIANFRVLMPAPPELVWEYLTNPEALPEWLGNGEIASEAGGKIMLRSGGPYIRGTVLEIEKPLRLAYTWNPFLPGEENAAGGESVLRFDLEPEEGGTILSLSHGPIDKEYRSRTIAGWHVLLEILEAALADQPAPDFMERFERVHPDYEKLYG